MLQATEIKRNALLEMDNAPWQVLDVAFQSPSARGASTLVKVKVKNLKTGQVLAKSFRGSDMLEEADYERRTAQFLYKQDKEFFFMDSESFDQFELDAETLGTSGQYLVDGMEVTALMYKGQALTCEPPQIVDLEITDTAPALKNATAQAQLKPATLETGAEIQVPPYLTTGEKVRVDTRDGHFVGRSKAE